MPMRLMKPGSPLSASWRMTKSLAGVPGRLQLGPYARGIRLQVVMREKRQIVLYAVVKFPGMARIVDIIVKPVNIEGIGPELCHAVK